MPNEVTRQRGIITCRIVGNQTPESIRAVADQVSGHIRTLQRAKQPVLIFVDTLHSERGQSPVRKVGAELLSKLHYHKIALLCPGTVELITTNFIITAVGKNNKVKAFLSKTQAMRWLRS